MAVKNAFYAQSGGVTAVINGSACGVLQTARQHVKEIGKVFAGRNGIIGALTEDLIDTSVESETAIAALKHTPGAAFGSCRYKLGSIHEDRAQYERLIEVFRAHDIGFFFYNGGGDSQDTTYKVSQLSEELAYPIVCVGIPKTMDNDLYQVSLNETHVGDSQGEGNMIHRGKRGEGVCHGGCGSSSRGLRGRANTRAGEAV